MKAVSGFNRNSCKPTISTPCSSRCFITLFAVGIEADHRTLQGGPPPRQHLLQGPLWGFHQRRARRGGIQLQKSHKASFLPVFGELLSPFGCPLWLFLERFRSSSAVLALVSNPALNPIWDFKGLGGSIVNVSHLFVFCAFSLILASFWEGCNEG